jgi:hypothetical protein
MIERADAFVRRAARTMARHAATVLAVDLGNEMDCLPDAATASRSDIARWCERICGAIRAECPSVLIVSGCDHGQVIHDTPWAFDNQPGCDFLSMHAYPVPAWHPVPLGGLRDPFTERAFAFYCAYARTYGPVLFQEFGSFLTQGPHARSFLRRMLPAVAATGVNGMLWWCLHDVTGLRDPYAFNGVERSLGLVDAEGRVKPELQELVARLAGWAADPSTLPNARVAQVSLYVPDHTLDLSPENLRHPNASRQLSPRLLMAWHLAQEAGLVPEVVRSHQLPPPRGSTLLLAGVTLHPEELARLSHWVRAGGHVIWHGVPVMAWGPESSTFLGARPVDYALAAPTTLQWADETWTIAQWPDSIRLVLEATTAQVLAVDAQGNPAILRNAHGDGSVTFTPHLVEDAARSARQRSAEQGDQWHRWIQVAVGTTPGVRPKPIPTE